MLGRNARNRVAVNPSQPMMGKCLACGHELHCFYADCTPSRDPMDDLPRAECPVCKERSLKKQGTAVQMVKVQS